MGREEYTDADYTQPHVPPATPPVIDSNADADDAATRPMPNGDSDFPGSRPGSFPRGREDEELHPGGAPIEKAPERGDTINPGDTPDEIRPDSPSETELPPD